MSNTESIFTITADSNPAEAMLALIEHRNVPTPLTEVWEEAFEHEGRKWHVALNPSGEPAQAGPHDGMRGDVPGFSFAVWFNGWLAGFLSPLGDGVLADGAEGNSTNLVRAIMAELER